MGNPVWAAATKSRAGAEGRGKEDRDLLGAGGDGDGDGGEEEASYRLNVVKRLPGLVTLDCVDVTEAERGGAKSLNEKVCVCVCVCVSVMFFMPRPALNVGVYV